MEILCAQCFYVIRLLLRHYHGFYHEKMIAVVYGIPKGAVGILLRATSNSLVKYAVDEANACILLHIHQHAPGVKLHYYVLQAVGHGSLGNRDQAARPLRKWAVLAPTFVFQSAKFSPRG